MTDAKILNERNHFAAELADARAEVARLREALRAIGYGYHPQIKGKGNLHSARAFALAQLSPSVLAMSGQKRNAEGNENKDLPTDLQSGA